MKHELPDLPYDHAALEPHIDARTMALHHARHHAGYVARLDAALEPFPEPRGGGMRQAMTQAKEQP